MIESVPTGKLFVTKLAMPFPDKAAAPSSVVPSKNSAMPVVAPLTVAVIKTAWPYCDVLGRFCKATVMADVLEVWVEGGSASPWARRRAVAALPVIPPAGGLRRFAVAWNDAPCFSSLEPSMSPTSSRAVRKT